ncbi:uncharacterized protein TRAVEDRAFT_66008 [Trametes versicolor FP-101664 SS1]|uniref:uncharacterized protein n=1 Tax=Trametes versicolor (strain FP-101664) TaxID=717944 RepID=UPI0004622BC1|nr:uncharacterized protein TRAVEDRAFT_66008 [Trametes versicolor FP-101664 SS1]EIW55635.1 hypothetical protein TRAVEDRAFT_66008 [Trametes versicolor FP-101664 SS1]
MSATCSPTRVTHLRRSRHGMQPNQPSTPVRGRNPSRYPTNLSVGEPGRVPLHRRGTSKTYETMEDLLRENGYKETRVFTPEAERIQALADEQKKQHSGWRIKDLLTGWITGAEANESASEEVDGNRPEMSQGSSTHAIPVRSASPASPLGNKRRAPQQSPSSPAHSASSTTLSSMMSSNSDGRTVSYQHIQRRIHHNLPDLRQQPSSNSLRTYAQVSAARGYLRHMASAPNMPKRSAPPARETSIARLSSLLNPPEPPMPPSWIETVAKAVMKSSDAGAHIGGPLSRPGSRQSMRPLRTAKENKPAHAQGRSVSGLPPGSAFYMQRPQTAPGAVSTTHVVCRSAPGSRSASRVGERNSGAGSLRGAQRNFQDRGRRGSKGKHADRVPSLAAMDVESDAWNMRWVNGQRVPLLLGLDSPSRSGGGDDDYDDDDDDGELDLARLLVPARRQYSIQSLRRHLHHSQVPHPASPPTGPSWEDEEDVPVRGRHRRSETEDADGFPPGWGPAPSFGRADTKRRRALPGPWAGLAGGSGGGRS